LTADSTSVRNEQLAGAQKVHYIPQVNFTATRDSGQAPFWKFCTRSCLDCPWEHACHIWSP